VITVSVGDGWARAVFTERADGDMGHGGVYAEEVSAEVSARRRQVVDAPWTWLRQVHGAEVVRVLGAGEGAGTRADGSVTSVPGAALAILTADCAPVALASPEGVVGAAHAGWTGVTAGVVQRTVAEMRALGATSIAAVIGPTIGPGCYQFGDADLARVEAVLGPSVRSRTSAGAPALDLPAAVDAALRDAGVDRVIDARRCTACDPNLFSWRARRDVGRQAMVVWR
jgi:YfiH family protein